ncbi:hypothetical protein T03_5243, partial [Trichinella britovi]
LDKEYVDELKFQLLLIVVRPYVPRFSILLH